MIRQKTYLILISLSLFVSFNCSQCRPSIEDLERELNNGNTNPATLVVALTGSEVRQSLAIAWGIECLEDANFTADVEIVVRTGLLSNGQIIPDPNPYYDRVFQDLSFEPESAFGNFPGTRTTIAVPSEGAYYITYTVTVDECSLCCSGTNAQLQCGVNQIGMQCEGGLPRIGYEALFLTADRPPYYQDLRVSSLSSVRRSCVCNNCLTDC